VALPGRPDQPVQVIDSGDLAILVGTLLAADEPGTYNAVGPADPTTISGLIVACAEAAGSQVEVVPVDPTAVPGGLPLMDKDPGWDVMHKRSAAKARAAGMPATPLTRTAAAVLAWDRERGEPPLTTGLSPQDEAALLSGA
jgi:2'-hydroxyisoflavone reductase